MLEYGAHVRDVLVTIRDRLVIGLVEYDPGFKPLCRGERINLGQYSQDTPSAVVAELGAATGMLVRLFGAIEPELLSRSVQCGSASAHAALDGPSGDPRIGAPPHRHQRESATSQGNRLTVSADAKAVSLSRMSSGLLGELSQQRLGCGVRGEQSF